MYDDVTTFEYADLLLSIEEIKNEISNNYRVIDDGVRVISILNNMKAINAIGLENINTDKSLFDLTLDTLNIGLESIGSECLVVKDNISFEDNIDNITTSIEGIAADVWLAIKKIFEKISTLLNTFYENIRKFFGVAKIKAAEIKTKLDELPDLNDFEIEKNALAKFILLVNKSLPLYSAMGLDILSDNDFKKYNECLIDGNRWILSNTELLIKGNKTDTPTSLLAPSKLKLIHDNSSKVFQNVKGILDKKYTESINCHFLLSFKHNSANVITILKDKSVMKLVHSPLVIDTQSLQSNHKKVLSKLNKNKIHSILEALSKLGEEQDKFKKDNDSFKQKMELEFKDLSNKQLGSEAIFVTNTNTVGNLMSGIGEALVKHMAIYQSLSDKLTTIYADAAKKSK
jgi:hypothetical protein